MRKAFVGLVLVALVAASWFAWQRWPRAAAPWDGQVNSYRVQIDPDLQRARIEADIFLAGDMLSMFSVMPVPTLPGGQVDLIEDLMITDASGNSLSLRDLGLGDYEIDGRQRVKLSYAVRLEHDRHAWPPGKEEVGYRTDEGLMLTGASLFFADGGEKMEGPITVEFELPPGWRAVTPWARDGAGERYIMQTRRELLSNALFLGTIATETVEVGGVELTLAMGRRYVPSRDLFVELLRTQLDSYVELFGGKPRAGRYLIIINEDAGGDGGAFVGSFSQFIAGDADERNRVIWGYVMAHELLHFWNGLSIVPSDYREEWFKEGATDYLTIATLAKNGLIDEGLLFKRLENVPRRYLIARYAQGLGMSVREAGKDKQPNRQLVYGGGSLAAMALDVELRVRSDDRVGLPQLLQALHAEFGAAGGSSYRLDDIERHAQGLTGTDFAPFFDRVVESNEYFDIRPSLVELGLRMDSFVEEMFIAREPQATPEQRARFAAIFVPVARSAPPAAVSELAEQSVP